MTSENPIIVTGGASGIGEAICRRLAELGYPVAIFDLDTARSAALADELSSALAFTVNIADYAAVADAVAKFEAATGPVYGLVNNAGWDEAKPFIDTDTDLWRKVIDVNLYGPINVTHIAVKRMAEAERGRVVSIASDAGRVGSSGEAVYSAAKGGVIAFMKALAREHARQGLTFNTICPGPTDTPLLAKVGAPSGGKLVDALERAIPMRRLAKPEDFPGLVAFFLSQDAAFITGQTISVSGGLSMHG
jgi:2-hydroxycyclohexanecarboxyl-CoA dehydrogenase